jgi:hypothetical protein
VRPFGVSILFICNTFLVSSCSGPTDPGDASHPLTLQDVYLGKITSMVGEDILLSSRLHWHSFTPIPWRSGAERDTVLATQLTLRFEHGDRFVPQERRGEDRGNMFVVSDRLESFLDDQNVEGYRFGDRVLDRETTYLLRGRFKIRDWLGIDEEEALANPKFVEQANQVTYWSQIFEFRLESVRDPPSFAEGGPSPLLRLP